MRGPVTGSLCGSRHPSVDGQRHGGRVQSPTLNKRLRIVVHDYSGHPFQVELSRALARRGHDVLHLHSAGFQTPKGPLANDSGDPPTFAVEGIDLGEPFRKYSYVRRLGQSAGTGTSWRHGSMCSDPMS